MVFRLGVIEESDHALWRVPAVEDLRVLRRVAGDLATTREQPLFVGGERDLDVELLDQFAGQVGAVVLRGCRAGRPARGPPPQSRPRRSSWRRREPEAPVRASARLGLLLRWRWSSACCAPLLHRHAPVLVSAGNGRDARSRQGDAHRSEPSCIDVCAMFGGRYGPAEHPDRDGAGRPTRVHSDPRCPLPGLIRSPSRFLP